jgi:hypothetical protein
MDATTLFDFKNSLIFMIHRLPATRLFNAEHALLPTRLVVNNIDDAEVCDATAVS